MSKHPLLGSCPENGTAGGCPEKVMLKCSVIQGPCAQRPCLCWGRALSGAPQTHLTYGGQVLLGLGKLESEQTCIRMPAGLPTGCETLGLLFCLHKPQFCHLKNGDNISPCPQKLCVRFRWDKASSTGLSNTKKISIGRSEPSHFKLIKI